MGFFGSFVGLFFELGVVGGCVVVMFFDCFVDVLGEGW